MVYPFNWFTSLGEITKPKTQYWNHENFNGWTDIVTVARIWCFSLDVTVVVTLVSFISNKLQWLNNLGPQTRSKGEIEMESLLGRLHRVPLKHEKEGEPMDKYYLINGTEEEEELINQSI